MNQQKWYVPWLYILPTIIILGLFLVYPTIETVWVSFHDNYYINAESSDNPNAPVKTFVGFDNYVSAFTDPAINMMVAFRNNALWLVVMTTLSVGLGLVLAVLLDRVRYEVVAKSIIFLPMAISFTAASIIWRFIYAYRPPSRPQIGLLNGLLTSLSDLANDPIASQILTGALILFGGLALVMLLFGIRDRRFIGPFFASLSVALIAQFILAQGNFDPRLWLSMRPWINNIALIIVGVWVWTGFCMVILSSAYKGIPKELMEAARIDGATEWQVFLRITVPFMLPTIAVVTTTIVIFVLKTFDIVYVMTNGQFGTEVLANTMIKTMYDFRDFEKSSAIAVILLILILPFIVINIRRFKAQEAMR
jgi:alpha-glucoside transport system permease protein